MSYNTTIIPELLNRFLKNSQHKFPIVEEDIRNYDLPLDIENRKIETVANLLNQIGKSREE